MLAAEDATPNQRRSKRSSSRRFSVDQKTILMPMRSDETATPVRMRFKKPVERAKAGGGVGLRLYAVSADGEAFCGTVSSISGHGTTLDIRVDNGDVKEGLDPYTLRSLQIAKSMKYDVGSRVMIVQSDGRMADAEVVSFSGGKELGNQHMLRIGDALALYDLNEYNSVAPPRFASTEAYAEARTSYLQHVATDGQMVEDAITGALAVTPLDQI
eukprot:4471737-Prymnesium_polylepis.1